MKVFKMLGCLVLLCVMICGCVLLVKQTQVAAAEGEQPPAEEQQNPTDASSPDATEEEQEVSGSVTITPTYSEGLKFRSNGDGTCALAGMGSCTSSCLLIPPTSPAGDTVTEILPYALKDSIVGAVEIPATIKTLSAASFAGCPRLAYIRVAAGNESFSEQGGVLYNAAGTTLIYCPAALSTAELKLSENLRRISAGAFADCTALGAICFIGTTAEWHGVIVGDENDPLYAAAFKFTSN